MYDVIIVGAGVTGCAVARYLSRCQGSFLVLEREEAEAAQAEQTEQAPQTSQAEQAAQTA